MVWCRLNDIISAVGGKLRQGSAESEINGISVDSRTLNAGEAFIALIGGQFDGHKFLKQAAEKGASAFFVSEKKEYAEFGIPVVVVDDTMVLLADIARWWRGKHKMPVIAVTGSNGKTTTKELIAQVLSPLGKILKSPFSYNNAVGLPLTLLEIKPDHAAAIVEMGTNHPGEIKRLYDIAQPTAGIITNIGPSHLEFFEDLKGVAEEKGTLTSSLKECDIAFFNADDPFTCFFKSDTNARVVTFGFHNQADFKGDDLEVDSDNGDVTFMLNGKHRVLLQYGGRYNAYNALAAIAVAATFGIDCGDACELLRNFILPEHRLRVLQFGGIEVIDDSYNANPLSMDAALDFLMSRPAKGRKIAVLGDMFELGANENALHGMVGAYALKHGLEYLYTLGIRAMNICEVLGKGRPTATAKSFENIDLLVTELLDFLKKGDCVLIKGSRGMRMERIIETLQKNMKE